MNPADPSRFAPKGPIPGVPPGLQRFAPRPAQPTMHPRKVRGGVKLASKSGPVSLAWAAQRWMRLVEELAPNDQLAEGLVYARAGQAKQLIVPAEPGSSGAGNQPGHISARVQGRLPQAYTVDIRMPALNHEQWEKVLQTMIGEAKHVASMLAGEVPSSIEDVFRPHGLKLFPHEASDLACSCTCRSANAANRAASVAAGMSIPAQSQAQDTPFCKHVCCVMALVAERLGLEPFMIFGLRGMWKEDLLERLRQIRALASSNKAGASGSPMVERALHAISPRIAGVSDRTSQPLLQELDSFWAERPTPEALDLSLRTPEVSHPLLRRLGASPFTGAKFPLVGLLATCYDVMSEEALKAEDVNVEGEGGESK